MRGGDFLLRLVGRGVRSGRQTRYAFAVSMEANLDAMRRLWRTPALLAMELLWRWSFGLGVLGLMIAAWGRVRPVLLLSDSELQAIHSPDPIARAASVVVILQPYAPLLLKVAAWVALGAAVLWVLAATAGRGILTRILVRQAAGERVLAPDATRWLSYFSLTAARVVMLLILVIGYLAGVLLASVLGVANRPMQTVLIVLLALGVAATVWILVNWVLTLAPLFVARDGCAPLDANAEAVGFARRRWKELLAIAAWNGVARWGVAIGVSLAALFTVSARSPAWLQLALLALQTLAYLVLSDWLLLARLAAYAAVAVAEPPAR